MVEVGPDVDLLSSIEGGTADRRILEFAARGFVPLPPAELVRAVATISASGDAGLVALADETLKTFDTDALCAAVLSKGVRTDQLEVIARRSSDGRVLEPLIQARAVSDETLAWLAERVGAELQDVLITNQVRLLAAPFIVERLFENPQLSADIRRRADEFLEEFFLKKLREESGEELDEAIEEIKAEGETAPEAAVETSPAIGPDGDLTEEASLSLFSRVAGLSIVQRIRLAWRGSREERLFLVRDRNRLVCTAVLKSPKTSEGDVEAIAKMKSVSEDVLRIVGMNRHWTRRYPVALALVRNPRTPIDISVGMVNWLQAKDQKALAADRNVPDAVRAFARRAVSRRDV